MNLKRMMGLAALLISIGVHCQELTIHVDKKGKVGFVDAQGNVVIDCKYESAFPFNRGISIVCKSGKYGMIDTTGKVVLPLNYSSISPWNDLYMVKDGKKLGLVSYKGEIVLKPEYSFISKVNCYGKALIALGGKATANEKKTYMANAQYGIIDRSGQILVAPTYRGLYEFSFDGKGIFPLYEGKRLRYSYHNTIDTLETDCSFLGFSKNGNSIYEAGLMDGSGKELIKPGLYTYIMLPKSNMVRYYIQKKKETLCGYYDLTNNKAFQVATINLAFDKINYWSHGDFCGDIAPVNGNSWSFIDKTGRSLRDGYSSLKHSEYLGLWAAKNSVGTWDVFDNYNKDINALSSYTEINFPLKEGDKQVFSVQKDSKYGVISKTGQEILPFDYNQINGSSFDVIPVKKDGKWGAYTSEGKQIIPVIYENFIIPSERNAQHFWVQQSDSLYYHLNISSGHIAENGFQSVSNFEDGIALVSPVGFQVPDNSINRALLYAPNTPQKTIKEADLKKHTSAYGYLLNTDDILLVDSPVSTMYKDKIITVIKEKGRALTKMEVKNVLLDITKENRSYELNSTLGEDEWNY